jgi:hypothetical protein
MDSLDGDTAMVASLPARPTIRVAFEGCVSFNHGLTFWISMIIVIGSWEAA